jgi:hypothetical protein
MQKLRRGIEAIGPDHRSCLVIDPNPPEVLRIAQGLPKQPAKQEGAVNVALNAIVERDPQAIAVERLDCCDSKHHSFMLGQRLDRRQRLQFLGANPVISKLLGMEARPRPDEPQRTRWEDPLRIRSVTSSI